MPVSDRADVESAPGVGQAYLLFGVSLLLVFSLGAVAQVSSPRFGMIVTQLLLILLPALVFVRRKGLPVASGLRWTPVPARLAIAAMALGVTGWGAAVLIQRLVIAALGAAPSIPGTAARSPLEWLGVLIVYALLPGVCEEALFRGAIQGVMERRGAVRGAIVTGILFGVYHASPWVVPSAIFLGIVYGLAAVRTGSTLPSTLAHVANNATAVTAGFVLRARPEWTSTLTVALGILAVGFALAAFVFSRMTRDVPREAPLLAAVPAAVAGRASFWFKVAAVPIVMFAALTLFLFVREVYPHLDFRAVETSALEPRLHRGDYVVLIRRRDKKDAQGLGFRRDDIVSFSRDDSSAGLLARVVRVDGERVWIETQGQEIEIARDQVTGRVIYPRLRR